MTLEDTFKSAGYSGVPARFRYEVDQDIVFDRATGFDHAFLVQADRNQIIAVLNALESAPLPAFIGRKNEPDIEVKVLRAWAEDETGRVVKEFKPESIKVA